MTTSSTAGRTPSPGGSGRVRIRRIFGVMATLMATALIAACASSPTAPGAPAAENARSSHSSGLAYRDTPVQVAKLAPPRVSLDNDPRLGKADAKIGIVEFSDYECPYCLGFYAQVFPLLMKEYVDTGIAQFIRKDLPLTQIHPQAMPAALAAACAGDQGKYWEMHKALYANQQHLAPALYPELARRLGLDEAKFSACLKDPRQERGILRDMTEARQLGINGTPSFALGKIEGNTLTVMRLAKGAPDFNAFAQEIEKLRRQISKDAAVPAK
jgi:protein-disulfide isomerase